MKTSGSMTRSFVPLILTLSLCTAQAETYDDVSSASTAATVNVSLPEAYASDAWVRDGTGAWADEVKRREQELYSYLNDTDPARAEKYGFRAGQNPALAWNWYDQHPIGYGGMPYVLLQTLLSLDPAIETDPHLFALAKIWKRKSVIAGEQGKNTYTLDHLGFGPHPSDYANGIAKHPAERKKKLPNGLVYDPDVEPESVFMVNMRLKIMRDGVIGAMIRKFNPDYEPKIAKLLVLARGKIRDKLMSGDIDYQKDLQSMQEPPRVDAVFFSCSACHQGRVMLGEEMDEAGNIVTAGRMKFLPGMPNTEIEAQYFSKLLMLSGLALIESGFSADAQALPRSADEIAPSKAAIIALFTRMLTRAIDPDSVKSIYGPSAEQITRAKLQTYAVAKDFPKYMGDLIGVAIKTQYIYIQIAAKYAYNPDNPNKKTPGQKVPDVFADRVGQMDAFGIASGLVAIHTLRKDNSYLEFMYRDNPDNPILAGIETVSGFGDRVGPEEAGARIRANLQYLASSVPAPIDIKSLNWSGHRKLANWDGNQGASARALASGTSATGDPLKVNVRIHEPMNPLINHMPAPPYPFAVDQDKAGRGMEIFSGLGLDEKETCAGCHQPNTDWIFPVSELGVDPNRSMVSTDISRYGLATLVKEACLIFMRKNPGNDWCLSRDEHGDVITDWEKSNDDNFKDTPGRVRAGKNGYKADMLHGIWARAPYLHNGSVPTLMHMLCPETRPTVFNRGSVYYDRDMIGFEWAVTPKQRYSEHDVMQVKQYDTREFGRANHGHTFGSGLCPDTSGLDPIRDREEIAMRVAASEIDDLLEYLKTL
ncbi:MAG: hypothetical protein IH907_08075 [Proteobacteria bacterium]|nr:hypothetical protein [Pseudomonadota bacterium]